MCEGEQQWGKTQEKNTKKEKLQVSGEHEESKWDMQRSERPHQTFPLKAELSGPLCWPPNSAGHKDLCGYTEEGKAGRRGGEEEIGGGETAYSVKTYCFYCQLISMKVLSRQVGHGRLYQWPELYCRHRWSAVVLQLSLLVLWRSHNCKTLFWVISSSVNTTLSSWFPFSFSEKNPQPLFNKSWNEV